MTAYSQRNIPSPPSVSVGSAPNAYRPSVPLSVYRELVQELQATQARAETLENQNQHLVRQNKRLRLEIDKVVHSAQQLEQVAKEIERNKSASPNAKKNSSHQPDVNSVDWNHHSVASKTKPQIVEISPSVSRHVSDSKDHGGINGWVLFFALVLIVLTSCAGAFLIVSSKLAGQNR